MLPLSLIDLTLPLTNPVLKFLLILIIILSAPLLLNKIRIPHLLGLIIAGAVIGPFGFNLMERDSSIIMSGTVGLLYIMFLAGLEIDIADFKKNSWRSLVFGLFTFTIPMAIGILAGIYLLNFNILTSILLASMFASHTLITYPIISKLGVQKNPAVTITVGGTMITDTLALLVLTIIVGLSAGSVDNGFWIRLGVSLVLFAGIILLLFPLVGRWFFKRFHDNVSQYIFVLAIVFLGAVLAEAAGIESIIGAFLAGLAMNRLIPRTSPLMNRIEFVGNAIFIPFFLIGVGMLIDYRAFFKDFETIKVATVMTVVAIGAKFLAAYATQKAFRYSIDQRRLVFGLSNSQAAATLAAVMVGYGIVTGHTETGEPIRLLNESVLNGTILMILITCTVSSFVTQRGARNIALTDAPEPSAKPDKHGPRERILIPVSHPGTAEELIHLSVTIKSKGSRNGLYALHVVSNDNAASDADRQGRRLLEKAVIAASATDNEMQELLRYDSDIANAIVSTIHEQKITDLILGIKPDNSDETTVSFPSATTEGVLSQNNVTTLVYKPVQPLSTVGRLLVFVPDRAEYELGFALWMLKVWNMGRNTSTKVVFYASAHTLERIKAIHAKNPIEAEFHEFSEWDDFLILLREVRANDILLAVLSRKGGPSYHKSMNQVPSYLSKYARANSFILIYPLQQNDPRGGDLNNPSLLLG
ncbi:cation:proton antiporter [Rikenella microfusus]|uniref:K(+)/H(+) antiporter n=1 Tax=Rikenella microfusus TaxID=28139 RepID=A0A379MSJ6_9BACT|nr:cation:proton antiporter [Rikenella microfusus]SUE34493.1 K(+)/H(+) antiporter [Rikenella microfusus]